MMDPVIKEFVDKADAMLIKKNMKTGRNCLLFGLLFAGIFAILLFLKEKEELWIMVASVIAAMWLFTYSIYCFCSKWRNEREKKRILKYGRMPFIDELKKAYRNEGIIILLGCYSFAGACLAYMSEIIAQLIDEHFPDNGLENYVSDLIFLLLTGGAGIIFIIFGTKFLMNKTSDKPLEEVYAYVDRNATRNQEIQKLNEFRSRTDNFFTLICDRELFVNYAGDKTTLAESSKLLWVYQKEKYDNNGKAKLILYVVFKDGRELQIAGCGEASIGLIQDYLGYLYPYLAYGYTEFLVNEYKNNRANFIAEITRRREAYFASVQ